MSSSSTNADSSGRLLRSGAEIARVIDALVAQRVAVTARLESAAEQFSSQIVHADPGRQFILLTKAPGQGANAALYALPRVTFSAVLNDWQIEFVAVAPREETHGGAPVIRLRYPEILSAQRRRRHPRVRPGSEVPLQCLADAGGITPFDAQVVDISQGGIGVLVYAPEITLEVGTVLAGSRIAVPGRNPVVVDLEVHYSEVVALPDGRRARRSGCRFINPSDEVKKLVDELAKS